MTLPRLEPNPACTNEILISLRFQICAFCPSFVIPLLSDIIDFRQISHLRPIFSLWSVLQSTTKTSKRALSIHLRCRGKRDRLVGRPRERERKGGIWFLVFSAVQTGYMICDVRGNFGAREETKNCMIERCLKTKSMSVMAVWGSLGSYMDWYFWFRWKEGRV